MATIVTTSKLARYGDELRRLGTSGQQSVDTLKNVKTGLMNLRDTVTNDPDCTPDDVAEVQAVIDDLAGQIQGILA